MNTAIRPYLVAFRDKATSLDYTYLVLAKSRPDAAAVAVERHLVTFDGADPDAFSAKVSDYFADADLSQSRALAVMTTSGEWNTFGFGGFR
jgi:hypothetical protein